MIDPFTHILFTYLKKFGGSVHIYLNCNISDKKVFDICALPDETGLKNLSSHFKKVFLTGKLNILVKVVHFQKCEAYLFCGI